MKNSECVVLVPFLSNIEPETEQGLRELTNRGYVVRLLRGSSQIDLARSQLATKALRDGFAETFWIDADIVFDPDDVDKIRAHNRPMVAGVYVKKDRSGFAGKFRQGQVKFGVGGGLLEMEYVGCGFLHVRSEVYERIASELKLPVCGGGYEGQTITPYFIPLLAPEDSGPCYLSEDFSFCYRARQAGYEVIADTTIRLEHVGRYRYSWDDLASQANKGEDVSAKLYEQIGRKQERLEELDAAYTLLLTQFAGVVSGEIDRHRVMVNLTDRSWAVAPEGQRPSLPATINGLPNVVVAPDDVPVAIKERQDALPVNGEPVKD